MKPLRKARNGVCSIGWLFMGEMGGPCDKHCQMCYYAHQKNLVFYSLATMIQHANLFRHYYGLDGCDITGGEPTIFRDIVQLVAHCKRIGLSPRIITHGQNIRDDFRVEKGVPLYRQIEEAGLEVWRFSIHGGSAASHDAVLGEVGSFERIVANFDRPTVETQFNTTLLSTNYKDLPVNLLKDRKPTVWNMVNFLPYFYWAENQHHIDSHFQVQYLEAAPYVARAIEEMEARGWEVNLRYWPFCVAKDFGFAENVCDYHQVPFDPWEWRLNVTGRTPIEQIEKEGGWYESERLRAAEWMKTRANEKCAACSLRLICDGPPEQYQAKYGLDEIHPIEGELVTDPTYFTRLRVPREGA